MPKTVLSSNITFKVGPHYLKDLPSWMPIEKWAAAHRQPLLLVYVYESQGKPETGIGVTELKGLDDAQNTWRISLTNDAHCFIFLNFDEHVAFFFSFTAAPAAYGISQVRGEIIAAAVTYVTATATLALSGLSNLCLWKHWILNPQREARDGTHILTETTLGL